MNFAVIAFRHEDYAGTCEAMFLYRSDAEEFAEERFNDEGVHFQVVRMSTLEIISECEV